MPHVNDLTIKNFIPHIKLSTVKVTADSIIWLAVLLSPISIFGVLKCLYKVY